MSARVDVVFDLAVAENGAFGKHGTLPWKLPNDLKRFKALSMGKPIVMGRRTFSDDVKTPLKGRVNIVVTRNKDYQAEGVIVALSVEEALKIGAEKARAAGVDEIHVIGGAEIFRAALPYARRIYLTEVHARPEADTFLEPFDAETWRETFRERHEADERHFSPYTFLTLERVGEPLPIG
jgi:dihydrofolate reductase